MVSPDMSASELSPAVSGTKDQRRGPGAMCGTSVSVRVGVFRGSLWPGGGKGWRGGKLAPESEGRGPGGVESRGGAGPEARLSLPVPAELESPERVIFPGSGGASGRGLARFVGRERERGTSQSEPGEGARDAGPAVRGAGSRWGRWIDQVGDAVRGSGEGAGGAWSDGRTSMRAPAGRGGAGGAAARSGAVGVRGCCGPGRPNS